MICVDAPHGNTVRGYLNEQLTPDHIRAVQRDCNRTLASQLPTWLRDHPKEVAIDLHDQPYYGCETTHPPRESLENQGETLLFRQRLL
jgi:hypothetical protein